MILSAIAEKLKRRSKDDFKGCHFEASLILQAVCWYLRYPLSYRNIEELFLVTYSSICRTTTASAQTLLPIGTALAQSIGRGGCRFTAPAVYLLGAHRWV